MSAVLVAVILSSVDGAPAQAQDVLAQTEQAVQLHAAVQKGRGRGCRLYTSAKRVKTRCKVLPMPAEATVHWYKVEAAQKAYDNVPGGKFGFASIDWVQSAWRKGDFEVPADVRAVRRRGVKDAGTMRYRIEVAWPDGRLIRSAELAPMPGGPTSKQDLRKVTLRPDDTYLGYMTELAGLPYIFGSAAQGRLPHQAERRVGVDCADLMIYGLRRMGHKLRYRSSRTLGPISRSLGARIDGRRGGLYLRGGERVPVGPAGIIPGDWIIFEGHVGAFMADRGHMGWLDEADLVIHIAWKEVAIESLADSGYGTQGFELRRPNVLAQSGSN